MFLNKAYSMVKKRKTEESNFWSGMLYSFRWKKPLNLANHADIFQIPA